MMHFSLTGSHTESPVKWFGTHLAQIYLLVLRMKELRIEPESNVFPEISSLSENNRVHIWSVTGPSLQVPAFGGTVSHQGCFLRFMRRGLISNGPFSSREDITVKPIFYSISPALLWCLMLLRFRLQGHSLDCSICFYFLYCTTYLALSDITQFCFSFLAPKSFSPPLLCSVLVLLQATCFQPYQHSLLFLHTCFSCHTFLILGRPA